MSSNPQNHWALKPVHVQGLPPWIDIHPEEGLTVGRANDNDVSLGADSHASVSAHHMRLSFRDGEPLLSDLGSTNGTYVNGIRVQEKALKSGDLIGVGTSGPKFVIQKRQDMSHTQLVEAADVAPKFGESTIQMVREAVGLEEDHDVKSVVHQHTRSNRTLFSWVAVAVLLLGGGTAWYLADQNARQLEELNEQSRREIARLEAFNAKLQGELQRTNTSLQEQQQEWLGERERLQREKTDLLARIQKVERGDTETIAQLQKRLEATNASLDLFNPVNLERAKLQGVSAVREAVVFIETSVQFKERDGEEVVRSELDTDGRQTFRLGGEGEILATDQKSGSGFVVSKDGWILTNAHVIEAGDTFATELEIDGKFVEPTTMVDVVFNNERQRYPARVVAQVHDEQNDFALLKIEPFDGMPSIAGFDINRQAPPEGAEVFLFGFPLGKRVVQGQDDTVVASTFKGILSRKVEQFLQVDAAVHPGNSGGPVTDATGRVIGIVTAVQRMDDGNITPSIGYVIPIDAVAKIWPPEGK